jgi:hypothetical protein
VAREYKMSAAGILSVLPMGTIRMCVCVCVCVRACVGVCDISLAQKVGHPVRRSNTILLVCPLVLLPTHTIVPPMHTDPTYFWPDQLTFSGQLIFGPANAFFCGFFLLPFWVAHGL